MALQLRPMSSEELEAWYPVHEQSFLDDRIRTGEPEDVARAYVREQSAAFFPGGRPGPRHEVLALDDENGRVGVVWVGPYLRREDDFSAAWLYKIEVDEAFRGRGYAREALSLLEAHLARSGVRELGLNVFGDNDTARRLYVRAGFRESAVTMNKTLSPG